MSGRGVVLFYTVHALLRLEKALVGRGLTVETIPTPRHLSSDCGTALSFPSDEDAVVRATIAELGLEIEGIHELDA